MKGVTQVSGKPFTLSGITAVHMLLKRWDIRFDRIPRRFNDNS